MSGNKVNIALIGAGGWGMQHARIYAGRPDVDFCAIVGRTLERTKERAERFGTRYYTNIQQMLEKEKPDLVSLCLPNQGHFDATMEVIRSGFPIETQCHAFDILEHLCGPIQSIMAEMTDMTGKGYSTLSIALRFANRAVGGLVGSYDSFYAYPGTHFMEINGTKGRVTISDTVKRYTYHPVGSEIGEVWEAGYFNDRDREFHRTFDAHFDDMLTAFKKGDAPPVHAKAGARALALARAAIESFESGKRILV